MFAGWVGRVCSSVCVSTVLAGQLALCPIAQKAVASLFPTGAWTGSQDQLVCGTDRYHLLAKARRIFFLPASLPFPSAYICDCLPDP
jgi:hypothetical protein